MPVLKKGRQVIKAIVASAVHPADSLLPITVGVSHPHFPTENCANPTDWKKARTRDIVSSSLPLPPQRGV